MLKIRDFPIWTVHPETRGCKHPTQQKLGETKVEEEVISGQISVKPSNPRKNSPIAQNGT